MTSKDWMGEAIRAARCRANLTQEALAAALNLAAGNIEYGTCDRHMVSRWENNRRTPTQWRPFIEQVLGVDLSGYLELRYQTAGAAADVEVDPVDRRKFIGAGGAVGLTLSAPTAHARGRRLGSSDIDHVRQQVSDLRRLDDYSGGATVYPLAVAEIEKLSKLASTGSFSVDTGHALLGALAELYQFTSWVAFDTGRLSSARQLALSASNAANEAGDRTLGATALSELSYLTASSANPTEGVAMARASLAAVPDAVPAVRVVLADRLAWAYARVGDAQGVDRALGISEDTHNLRDSSPEEEPDMVYWICRDESQIMSARCWSELHQSKRAIPVLEKLSVPYDDTHAREVSLFECWSARAYLDEGSLDQAVSSARRAVRLAGTTSSPRTSEQIRQLLASFKRYRNEASVADLLAETTS